MPKMEAMLKLGGRSALCKVQCAKVIEYCAREGTQVFGGSHSRGGQGEKVERRNREVRAMISKEVRRRSCWTWERSSAPSLRKWPKRSLSLRHRHRQPGSEPLCALRPAQDGFTDSPCSSCGEW
eukprot:Skav200806  [mRNA]  locus=scaffold5143:69341:69712:- [translate_table: standard]